MYSRQLGLRARQQARPNPVPHFSYSKHMMSKTFFAFPRTLLSTISLFMLALGVLGCPGPEYYDEPEPTPAPQPAVEQAPDFYATTEPVALDDGTQGFRFVVRPTQDVVLVKIEIKLPTGSTETYNMNSRTFLKGSQFRLPSGDLAYRRMSGTWKVILTGNKAVGTSQGFTVTKTVEVGA